MTTVNSTSDARTVNNVMRHEYRVLTEAEKIDHGKDPGMTVDELAHEVADLVICALHIANTNPLGGFSLQGAVLTALNRRNGSSLTDQPNAAHAFCGPFPEQSEDERTLRFMLALRCGEPGELYGDDGELQLGGFPYPIDFRRDTVQEIRRKLDARGMAKLIEQQRAADPTPAAQPEAVQEPKP